MKAVRFVLIAILWAGLCNPMQADELSPSEITNTVMRSAATNFTLTLTNATSTTLYWQAANTSGWVSLEASSGTIPTNATYPVVTNTVIITNSAVSLAAGTHYSRLFVYLTNASYNSTGTVDMTLNVAEFERSTPTISKTIMQSGTTNDTLQIWNAGAGELSYSIQTNVSWLVASPVTGVLTGETADATNTISVLFTNTPLTIGAHYGTLTFVSGLDGSTLDVNVELNVDVGPQMSVSPSSMSDSIMMGQNPTSRTFRVLNISTNYQLGYGITTDCSWLTITPTNGTLDPQTTNESTVSFQASGLTTNSTGPSNYYANITITATNSGTVGSPATIAVSLTVNPKARLALDKSSLTNITTAGYDASDSAFKVWNGSGYYILGYSITGNVDWLKFTPSSGTSTGEQDVITVQYSTTDFTPSPDTSNAVITITGRSFDGVHWDSAVDATQTISVLLSIVPAMALATDASGTYEFSARQGHPADSTSFHVWNANSGGTLQYLISTNASWLSVQPASGTSAGEQDTITFSCRTTGLSPGGHTGTITIHGYDSDTGREIYNSPTNFSVMLTIIGLKGFDFRGDSAGASDLVVYEELTGLWSIKNLATDFTTNAIFGGMDYIPVAGDYNGDGITDLGVYRFATGYWYTRPLTNDQLTIFGGSYWLGPRLASAGGYVSVAGDYDGDGLTDPAMYRELTGGWSALFSGSGYAYVSGTFGGPGYTAIQADYDGDGKTDPAVYNESSAQWYVLYSSDNYRIVSGTFGGPGYTAAPADYDGDGLTDGGIYKESTGLWIILPSSTANSSGGYMPVSGVFGGPGFIPVPADYTGDGMADICLYDEAAGDWYIVEITGARVAWRYRHGGYGFTPVKP